MLREADAWIIACVTKCNDSVLKGSVNLAVITVIKATIGYLPCAESKHLANKEPVKCIKRTLTHIGSHSELHHMSECIVLPPSLFIEASNPVHISLNLMPCSVLHKDALQSDLCFH